MSTDAKISALRESHLMSVAETFDSVLNDTESPIERLFAAELLRRGAVPSNRESCLYRDDVRFAGIGKWRSTLVTPDDITVWLIQPTISVRGAGKKLATYRVDFAIVAHHLVDHGKEIRFVVECDGHDFHEKTKQQARADKSRDRVLQAAGWRVFRYTGSEIYEDVERCVEEADCAAWTAFMNEISGGRPDALVQG